MKLFTREIIIYSSLSITKVIDRLSSMIEPEKGIRIPFIGYDKFYEGVIEDRCFNIKRVLNSNFGFPPIIIGTIENDQNGVKIKMNMKPGVFTVLKMVFIAFFLILLNIALLMNSPMSFKIFLPLIALLILLLIATCSYLYECNRVTDDILKAIKGRIERR
jgi:hypothetical protein